MAFPPEFLREVGERNRIEDVAASYVNLRRRGKNLVGLCPFHNEKTPSFCIYPENNSFFCFGCNKGGDVISFVMGVENLDFAEAVKFLAQRAGMALPEDGADLSMSRLRTRILEINRESGRFYYSVLSTPEGKAGVEYFRRRGLDPRERLRPDKPPAEKGLHPGGAPPVGHGAPLQKRQLVRPLPGPGDVPHFRPAGERSGLWGADPHR